MTCYHHKRCGDCYSPETVNELLRDAALGRAVREALDGETSDGILRHIRLIDLDYPSFIGSDMSDVLFAIAAALREEGK